MEIKVKIDPASWAAFEQSLQNKLQVAAVKGWEKAVELTPAAGETKYSTGFMRQAIRVQKTGDFEYTIYSPAAHSVFVEFGTGPKGKATGALTEFPNDPQPGMSYHSGEVTVTRSGGRILDVPYIRHTQGQEAQPFLRPALLEAVKVLKDLMR